MINIIDKSKCCGCHACLNACMHNAIHMKEDEEGFLYPIIDNNLCVDCHLCEIVCPLINRGEKSNKPKVYGCRVHKESTLLQSSSGGVFSAIAEYVIKAGGCVYAARFDDANNVIHAKCDNVNNLDDFRRSKYVQSSIGFCFRSAREYLRDNKLVLFVGTPCQIAGLKKYLRKEYENLIAIDFVCHGVPSPGIWKYYLRTLPQKIDDINFRDKRTGWPTYSVSFTLDGERRSTPYRKNPYFRGFLYDLYLRPSCYDCKFKNFSSDSDLTLADFWGVWKNYSKWNDSKGAGLVAINSEKGAAILDKNASFIEKVEITYKQAFIDYNNSSTVSATLSPKRNVFFQRYLNEDFEKLVAELTKESWAHQVKNYLHSIKMKLLK